jgi:hypothetical protein
VLTVALKVTLEVTVEVATQVTYLLTLFTLVLGLYIETLALGVRIEQGRNMKTTQNAVSVVRPFVRSFAHTFFRRSIHSSILSNRFPQSKDCTEDNWYHIMIPCDDQHHWILRLLLSDFENKVIFLLITQKSI